MPLDPDLQAMLTGNQQGQNMANGVAPQSTNPSGMPQPTDPTAPMLGQCIDQLTDVIDYYRRSGAPGSAEAARIVFEIVSKLQGLVVQNQKRLAQTVGDQSNA